MATIISSVTNVSSTVSVVIPVPGFNSTKTITIAGSGTQNLRDVVSLETLQTMQPLLTKMIANGSITSAATIDDTTVQDADFAAKQTAIATADLVVEATADAATQTSSYVQADAQSLTTLLNSLKAKYNLNVALTNALKAKVNAMNA